VRDTEKACPGLDPGWMSVLGQDHAQREVKHRLQVIDLQAYRPERGLA